jgi:hypothetical protein
MDLRQGLTIEQPAVTVPWSVSEDELRRLFAFQLHYVTDKYWTTSVRVLGNLSCRLGFHFRGPRGQLSELEFFRDAYVDQHVSFDEFQTHFEAAFGAPDETRPGTAGFLTHRWLFPGGEIIHLVYERFGPEEHMRIRRTDLT